MSQERESIRVQNVSAPSAGKMYIFSIDATTGVLTVIPGSPFSGFSGLGGLAFDAANQTAYLLDNVAPSNVLLYDRNAASGQLTLRTSITVGDTPMQALVY